MAASIHASKEYVSYFFTTDAVASRPTSWKVALHTADPGTGDVAEVAGGTYARQDVTFTATDKAYYYEAANNQDVSFPAAGPGQSYTVTHYSIRDGVSGENLSTGALQVPIPVVEGGVITFPLGLIKVRGV